MSWAASLLNRGSKQGSEGPAPSSGKAAAKGAADAGAKGATLVKAKGGVSRNVDVLKTRKNMASVISPGLIAEPFRCVTASRVELASLCDKQRDLSKP